MPEMRFARTCYDHLAGVLAIALRNELLRRKVLQLGKGAFAVTPAGKHLLSNFDICTDSLNRLRRSFAHKCLDWTERDHHIGGALGAALLSRLIQMKWLAHMRDTRAVRVTQVGERELEHVFAIRCTELRARSSIVRE